MTVEKQSLSNKLLNIQVQLKSTKTQFNKFGNYYYRNAEDILEALKPLCKDNRCLLTLHDQIDLIGDRYYVTATALLLDCDSDNIMECKASARESTEKKGMDASQITGASSSYARKYALSGMFLLDDNKDADSQSEDKKPESTQPKPAPTPAPKKETKPTTTKNFEFLEAMKKRKNKLNALTGDDVVYYSALGGKGYEKSNQIPLNKQKAALKFFDEMILELEESAQEKEASEFFDEQLKLEAEEEK